MKLETQKLQYRTSTSKYQAGYVDW